jgi:uroporphyrinogen decarboxylase
MLLELMRTSPDALRELQRKITDVFLPFCLACLDAGADGLFFATKWASRNHMTWPEYEAFGRPYEMEILDALKSRGAWVILHVCGDNTYLEHMLGYDVDVFSYDFFAAGALPPASVAQRTGKYVLGGIDPVLLQADPEKAAARALEYASVDGWIAGPSCVVPPQAPEAAIEQLQKCLHRSIQ